MATLNVESFREDYRDVAEKECSMLLVECLSDEDKDKLKEEWNKAGGYKVIPWWKWCLDNIDVTLKL